MAPQSANVSYYPDSKDVFNSFKTGKKAPATVRIDKIERVGDKVFAVSGSFSADDLQPGAMSKKLQGQTLPAVSGRFAFTEVPLDGMRRIIAASPELKQRRPASRPELGNCPAFRAE